MNKFQDMLAFTRVVELGSFTAAAQALATTTSAVTKSVTRIEENLGVQLLHRTTRKMHLTVYGSEFYERSAKLLADLDAAESAVREANVAPAGLVRISLPPSFGRMTLVPALGEFYRRFPRVQLDMCLKGQTANPIDGGFDLSVHSGRLADSRLINRILVRGPQKTVVSPEYLSRHGRPEIPGDLVEHNCVVGQFGTAWAFRSSEHGEATVRVSGNLTTDSGDALREAAVAGIGISQATWWLFRDDLRKGTLVPILEDFEIEADPISILYPAQARIPAKVRVVVDFLLEITRERWSAKSPHENNAAGFPTAS